MSKFRTATFTFSTKMKRKKKANFDIFLPAYYILALALLSCPSLGVLSNIGFTLYWTYWGNTNTVNMAKPP